MTDTEVVYIIMGGEYESSCNRNHVWVQVIYKDSLTAQEVCDTLNAGEKEKPSFEDTEYYVEEHELYG